MGRYPLHIGPSLGRRMRGRPLGPAASRSPAPFAGHALIHVPHSRHREVRERYGGCSGYCGVSEVDAGLTLIHSAGAVGPSTGAPSRVTRLPLLSSVSCCRNAGRCASACAYGTTIRCVCPSTHAFHQPIKPNTMAIFFDAGVSRACASIAAAPASNSSNAAWKSWSLILPSGWSTPTTSSLMCEGVSYGGARHLILGVLMDGFVVETSGVIPGWRGAS